MKFNEFKYERPNIDKIREKSIEVIDIIKNSDNYDSVKKAINDFNKVRDNFDTMLNLCYVRHSINTLDEFYNTEEEFFDNSSPLYEEINTNFLNSFTESKFSKELEKEYGKHLFDLIKMNKESFLPSIIELLQQDSKLSTEYCKLCASCQVEFDGKILNTSQFGPYLSSTDRNVRIEAEKALWGFYESISDKIDNIYDKMVLLRDEMAHKLGYNNFVELGYKRLKRIDYDYHDVRKYREQVRKDLVPLVSRLMEDQRKRINVSELKSYDIPLSFLSGNAKPLGDLDYKLQATKKMYSEMSCETKEFASMMIDNEYIDLMAKKGKESGGYCTYITDYEAPFVFSNFNGTSGDVDVLTHEFGHAYQAYSSRNAIISEYIWPTLEACEIHSMSMEFFAWPWMNLFFGDSTLKYKYSHLTDSITFIPYGVCVDEFQEWVYLNPNVSIEDRKNKWRELESIYTPWKKYDNSFLAKGNYWIRQSHIFTNPFYYIDYTLAQNCAHQFWIKDQENHAKAWEDYNRLCKAGGSMSFLDLLKVANLKNPFIDGTVKFVTEKLTKWLDSVNKDELK